MDRPDREQWLARFLAWARPRASVRALALTGSGARGEHGADEWSDLDLIVVTTTPRLFFATDRWLEALGKPWVSTVERTPAGAKAERRVLFAGGLDVDFLILGAGRARRSLQQPPCCEIVQRGLRVLLDRDGVFASLPVSPPAPPPPPAVEAFLEVVNDFWFHTAWTAKKLRRGELWTAKSCCDVYMKGLLLRMVEWHARAAQGWELDTWYNGRFLESWAPPATVAALRRAFAHYDEEDVWRALCEMMGLFRQLALDVAGRLGYPYPEEGDRSVSAWVEALRAEGVASAGGRREGMA